MNWRMTVISPVFLLLVGRALAEGPGGAGIESIEKARWQTAANARIPTTPGDSRTALISSDPPLRPVTHVSHGPGTLPNEHGQVWREYDITPYTSRFSSTANPEQAIVDWILRETGTEAWFSEPLGLLCANSEKLRVYHTRQMQSIVSEMVDRFASHDADSHMFSLRMVTLDSGNWRAKAHRMLRPVPVQSRGAEAWLLSKEDAALLLADLRKRTDFREQNSPSVLTRNGQTYGTTRMRPLVFTRSVMLRDSVWPGHELESGQIEEGYMLEYSPLLSLDELTIDAVIKCTTHQVEKFTPVWMNVPTAVDPRQRVQIQVPQSSGWRLHERFRWPTNDVLLVSCGMVATPGPPSASVLGLPASLIRSGPPRADTLFFLESKGTAESSLVEEGVDVRTGGLNYRGRY